MKKNTVNAHGKLQQLYPGAEKITCNIDGKIGILAVLNPFRCLKTK